MTSKIFYVYKDCTKDGRVFYIGKGQYTRVKSVTRNKLWCKIAHKYGHYREIVLGTRDEKYAFEIEVDLIKTYKTFIADWENGIGWGANLTKGGDGTSGIIVSKETRLKMSQAKMGNLNINFGNPKVKMFVRKFQDQISARKEAKK